MVNRMFVVILILTALLLVAMYSPTAATNPAQSGPSDLDACYARCPCNRNGIMDWACSSCKTRCEWASWRKLREQTTKKAN